MPDPGPGQPLPPLPVIVNRTGGTAAALGEGLADRIADAFAAAGRGVDLHLVSGGDVAAAVRDQADAPVVVVGGGDGTLGGAAHARVESGGGALGLLPLGTRNHLALELGIPIDLDAAAATIVAGVTRRIDLAEVNGTGFVNNASIGLYPLLVRGRDARRGAVPKWLATVPAAWAALRRLPHHRLHLSTGTRGRRVRTPLLFVGNNRYTLERGRVGKRIALDDGLLSVFAVAAQSRPGLIWLASRTLLGFSDPERDYAAIGETPAFTAETRSARIDIALDGEVHRMVSPLRFRVRPLALTVIVPAAAPAQDAAA